MSAPIYEMTRRHVSVHCEDSAVAYPGGGGVQQIQLRTKGRETGDVGAVAP
jgi:hypothetical protein